MPLVGFLAEVEWPLDKRFDGTCCLCSFGEMLTSVFVVSSKASSLAEGPTLTGSIIGLAEVIVFL